ncbi:MAG: hypothetical protein HYS38_02640 [Acidobacteria bacterium]|nr:hypothetical protein [Acidobacteriota bacterium]
MAYTAVGLAGGLADELRKGGFLLETGQADEAIKELFRAYFCLASLHTARYLQNSALNGYGVAMLDSLREYQGEGGDLVRQAFAEVPALDDAIGCYVHGKPSEADRNAIDDHRQLLRLSEDKPLWFFAGKVHLRTMRLLGLSKRNEAFLMAWFLTRSFIYAAVSNVFNNVVPVVEGEPVATAKG